MLPDFRVAHQQALDELLTEILATMMSQGLVKLQRVAQDGMRVRASAGSSLFRLRVRIEKCPVEAADQVARLAKVRENPDPGVNRRQQAARERAARERQARVEEALRRLPAIKAAKERQGKQNEKLTASQPKQVYGP